MGSEEQLVIVITGAASGFGKLTAQKLAFAGHIVYASSQKSTAEDKDAVKTFAEANGVDLRPLALDICEESSCEEAVRRVISDSGRIDVVVHNAGHMGYGPTEAFTPSEFMHYLDINCVGPHRLNRSALPHMRARRSGLLVWISSSSSRGGAPPFMGAYFAAKAAMDSLAVTYSLELSRFGIESAVVIPGAFTKGTSHFQLAGSPGNKEVAEEYIGQGKPYEGISDKTVEGLTALSPPWANVEDVAKAVVSVIGAEKGKRRFRTAVDPVDDGYETVSRVGELAKKDFLSRMGLADLLEVKS